VSTPRNLFLVGPMGAGKTTVGRRLARVLGKEFVDCDGELERRTGASVSLIFEIEGEAGFRAREAALLEEICRRDEVVVATGGGVVLDPANRALLVTYGLVIYLCAPLELLVRRMERDRRRPLLQGGDRRARIERLLAERDPLYRQVADIIVTTDEGSARHVVREITRRLAAL